MTHDEAEAAVSRPGKFEGEPTWVPIFWDKVLDSESDDEIFDGDTPISVFVLTHEDHESYPDLPDVYAIGLWEDSQGFVHTCAWPTKAHLDDDRARAEEAE